MISIRIQATSFIEAICSSVKLIISLIFSHLSESCSSPQFGQLDLSSLKQISILLLILIRHTLGLGC